MLRPVATARSRGAIVGLAVGGSLILAACGRGAGAGAGITVPKQQVNPMNYQNSKTRNEWLRPAAGTCRLRFQGVGGNRYEIPIVIGS